MREPLVLGYHAVSPGWDVPLTVTPKRLEQQVRRLMRLGFRPARFTDAVLAPTHDKTFVVTFDDGYRSVLRYAAPILDRLGVSATLFVPTAWIGPDRPQADWEDMSQWRRPGREHELELMSWAEVRALADRGWEIGAHTRTHPFLTRCDDATLHAELGDAKAEIESEIGAPCTSVAYPYGDVDDRVERAAFTAGYATGAALMGMREYTEKRHSSRLRFRRVGVFAADRQLRFDTKVALMALASASETMVSSGAQVEREWVPIVGPGQGRRVAVLIPCFNDGVLAHEAVASVREQEPVEVVVIDDCSTEEETAVALDELRARGVTVVRHEVNRGLSAARRTGLAATSAPFVFPLDSDDLLNAGALTRLADRLEADPAAAASFGDIEEFGTHDRIITVPVALDAYRVAYRNDYPVCSLFRRESLEAVGAWQDVGGMVGYEDWNLWMTLAERWDTAVHGGPGFVAVRRRLHGPRMLGDSAGRHRALYAELRRTHPRLFAEIGVHRRRSALSPPRKLAYPLIFGARPPLGIRTAYWAALRRLKLSS